MAIIRTAPNSKTVDENFSETKQSAPATSIEIARQISESKQQQIETDFNKQQLTIPVKDSKDTKIRTMFYLPKETVKKLKYHAKNSNRSMSEVMELLVQALK
ncbi:MAG: hypothetical protein LBH55_00475 [Mycoplasmataceae bacterium]|jgi:hypothetical protein|nr:hypothetical protein [Mycoplasmataceae bacterium]